MTDEDDDNAPIDVSSKASSSSPSPSSSSSSKDNSLVPDDNTWGPGFYERRRAQWTSRKKLNKVGETDNSNNNAREAGGAPRPPSAALEKLADVLSRPRVEEDDEMWDDYLKGIHAKLVGATRLRKGMSLPFAIKILHAGWLRDGTWTGDDIAQPSRNTTTTAAPSAPTTPIPSGPPSRTQSRLLRSLFPSSSSLSPSRNASATHLSNPNSNSTSGPAAATPSVYVPPWMK